MTKEKNVLSFDNIKMLVDETNKVYIHVDDVKELLAEQHEKDVRDLSYKLCDNTFCKCLCERLIDASSFNEVLDIMTKAVEE